MKILSLLNYPSLANFHPIAKDNYLKLKDYLVLPANKTRSYLLCLTELKAAN